MKIAKITLSEYKPFRQTKKQNNFQQYNTSISNPQYTGYQDFSINFRGRTPENFYEQEFNVKFMPDTMKKFLNANYDERKHIPPEQIMSESFKYLAAVDNFSDVKSTYPEEPLFANLHEASLKGRSGILSDIKIAKEISDTPLLNNGDDHLGMYLLRKIYLEGKTIKEINKDFYEKDLNPEYKGIVTQPITYRTTSAYGIRYPKNDFWHSFIATRDEYKKFFVDLPKQNKSELQRELAERRQPQANKIDVQHNEPPKQRKHNIKPYQKDHLRRDIVKTKGDAEAIKNAITRRFKKDDPEAAFIIKYLSPVMAVAADKIHLSEEMRSFVDETKAEGKKIENLFAQFWKARPELLEHYSTAITDTIELFEETYDSGGVLAINNEYQLITKDTENQKPIDFVSQRFIELLDYTQAIAPNREKLYALHEEEQSKWNEHFLWRYGEPVVEQPVTEKQPDSTKNPLELLEKSAKENNAKVYTLRGVNGDILHITANLDETLGDYIKHEFTGFPPKFVNLVIKKALTNPFMNEDAKLSFSTIQMADKIDDERILGETERKYIMNSITSELNPELSAASMATLNALASRSEYPQKIYRTVTPKHSKEDITEYTVTLLKHINEPEFNQELNSLYDLYRRPLTNSEIIKITNIVLNYIRNFDTDFANSEASIFYQNYELIKGLSNFKEKLTMTTGNLDKNFKQDFKKVFSEHIASFYFGKTLLDKHAAPAHMKAKTEAFINALLGSMIDKAGKNLKLL